jgi:capsule polysaccharide export protein KpsC/LpsZ
MAYNKEKLYQQAEEAIKKNNLFFIEDIVAFIPCCKKTFYEFFPVESNELHNLKELLEENKIKTKSGIRAKLWKSEKAAELLALYRLIATAEEHQKLNQSYIDHTTKGQAINISFED